MKISDIKSNPNNPRLIKNEKFKKLVQSIKDFPQMMELRPIIIDESDMALGGNMRKAAIVEVLKQGYDSLVNYYAEKNTPEKIKYFEVLFKTGELPESWVKKASELTEEQKNEFIIKDNVGFGEWDWDILANEWEADKLNDWGVDLPVSGELPNFNEQSESTGVKQDEVCICPKCGFEWLK